jgi:hypothetical protein
MLNEFRPTQVVAFHANIEASKGTRDMVELAKAAGIGVVLHGAEGRVDHWCSCPTCEADRRSRGVGEEQEPK